MSTLGAAPRGFARPGEAFRALGGVLVVLPALVRAWSGGMPAVRREAVMVAVSRANACHGCTTVHQRWALRAGVDEADLRAIGLGEWVALDPATRAAIAYATGRVEEGFRSPAGPDVTAASHLLTAREREYAEAVARFIDLANRTVTTATGPRFRSRRTRAASAPLFARVWDVLATRVVAAQTRTDLLADVTGSVVEVGAGNGANFEHYAKAVERVLAVEPEPHLRGIATRAARGAAPAIDVVDGTAAAIPAPDATFDSAVCCLVLCSVPDQAAALTEIARVLRPGGRLHFYEHVVAGDTRRWVQRALDSSGLWPRLGAGCHLSRDTGAALIAAGFVLERITVGESGPGVLTIPHILGVARKSAR